MFYIILLVLLFMWLWSTLDYMSFTACILYLSIVFFDLFELLLLYSYLSLLFLVTWFFLFPYYHILPMLVLMCFIWLSYLTLKFPMLFASITSDGSLFQPSIALFGKLYFLTSFFPTAFCTFSLCPLVVPLVMFIKCS